MKLKKIPALLAALSLAVAGSPLAAEKLTIATVNNGDMITMQKLSSAFERDNPDIELEWLVLEESVLRQRVTQDIATSGGQFDITTIGSIGAGLDWLFSLTANNAAAADGAAWSVLPCKHDSFSEKTSCWAHSETRAPDKKPNRPYHDSKAWIGFGCDDAGGEWTYIAFNSNPNLTGDKTRDGYNAHKFRAKWGTNKPITLVFHQDWGSETFRPRGAKLFLENLLKHPQLAVQVNYFSGGKRVFDFSLSGSSDAISRARDQCGA